MAAKVRCSQCHRKLNGNFTGRDCVRYNCPEKEKELFETLTFKDWVDPKFTVIEELECENKREDNYEWPMHTPNTETHYWNNLTDEWEEKIPHGFC